jgi:ABC-type molybdate transport system permease subunit
VADVQQAPLAYAARTAHSYALFWLPNDRSPWKQALTWLLNLPLLALACWLLVRGWPRWWHHPLGAPLALWWAGLPLAFAALAAITGYFIVLLPLLLAWVGMGLSARSLPLSVVS